MLLYSIEPKVFQFKTPSGTSRGILTEKKSWFIKLWSADNPEIVGTGECSIIEGLSPDYENDTTYYQKILQILEEFVEEFSKNEGGFDNFISFFEKKIPFPSILFGIETAFIDLINGGKAHFFDTDFTLENKKLPINGLIWMGSTAFLEKQIHDKLQEGYTCLKMKVSSTNFKEEIEILKNIRSNYSKENLILRVDANGAFTASNVYQNLEQLFNLNVHSIEQPIKAGNWELMSEICSKSSLPIALDEELIGISDKNKMQELIDKIQPQYLIFKPSLHGGITGTKMWIQLAEKANVPWWMTSALESNVGLNAICQFTSCFNNKLHQGLGTGSLYVSNTLTKLKVENGFIFLNRNQFQNILK